MKTELETMKSRVGCLFKKIREISKVRVFALFFAVLNLLFATLVYGGTDGKEILNVDERAWLEKHQSRLVLAVETGYAPFVFIDSKDQPTGLAHDYIRLIESKLGVHFNQKRFSSLDEIFQKVRNGEIHIVNAVTNTPARAKFLSMTEPFISVPNVIIVKKDRAAAMAEYDLQGLKVSLVKSYAITEHMSNRGLHFIPDLVPDDLSALLNVSFGRSDAAVIDLATASYLISEKGIANLRVAGEVAYDIRLSIGTPLNEPVLHDILLKGLNAITDAERLEIKNRWINASKNQSIFKDRQFWMVLGGVLAIGFAILAIVLVWNRTLRRQIVLRKQAETSLRESEELLKEAQRISQIGNWELDIVKGRLLWSDEIFRLFEIEPDKFQATYEGFLNAIHPEDRDAVNAAYTRSLENHQPYEITHRLQMSDGRVKWVTERCHSYFDAGGKPIRSIGTVQDITEQKLYEWRLSKERDFAESLINTAPTIILVLDTQGCIVRINPYMEAISGYTIAEVKGKDWFATFLPKAKQEPTKLLFLSAINDIHTHGNIDVIVTRSGQERIIEWYDKTLKDAENNTLGLLAIGQDITERKNMEDALHRSNADLEQFAYSVSHDMRQPLRAISGHLQLLNRSLQNKLDDDDRENLGFALDGAKRMDSMIVSLLDYSRVGRKSAAKQWIDSHASLDEAQSFLAPLIAETRTEVMPSGEWPQVFASRDELTRLLQNLIANAVKFRLAQQPAQVEIDSSVRGDVWRVSIRDYGIGIDPQQIGRLFKFFTRLQSRERFEGTGMGLALCRRIVEHHGGNIWVESEGEGKGSVFIFEIPLHGDES